MSDVIVKHIPQTVDLNEPVKKTYIDTLLATEDNLAHRFDISLMNGGEAVALPDGTAVTAYFIRYSDNATVPIKDGSISGNVASITLTKGCYNKPGQFALVIKVSGDGGIKNTVFYGEGTVFASSTDTIVDEENVVPSLSDLLAQIEAMETATEAAKTATTNAKSATTKANTATTNANNATTNANNAAAAANTAAEAANAAAQNWSNGTAANAIQLNGKSDEYYAARALISDAFDASKIYNSGDYCISENTLYKCLQDNVTGIAPTNTLYWEAVTVGSELGNAMKPVLYVHYETIVAAAASEYIGATRTVDEDGTYLLISSTRKSATSNTPIALYSSVYASGLLFVAQGILADAGMIAASNKAVGFGVAKIRRNEGFHFRGHNYSESELIADTELAAIKIAEY